MGARSQIRENQIKMRMFLLNQNIIIYGGTNSGWVAAPQPSTFSFMLDQM